MNWLKSLYYRLGVDMASGYGVLIGFFLGAVICGIIECCASSCSRKTTSVETNYSEQSYAVRDSIHTDSVNASSSTTSVESSSSVINSITDIVWNRVSYMYDSLGNKLVASEESATLNNRKENTSNTNNASFQSSTFIITQHDTIHDVSNNNADYSNTTVTYIIPWYWKVAAYVGVILVFAVIALILFMLFKYAVSFFHK